MKTFIYGLLLIGITPAYLAQNGNEWDLQKCVDYAQKHNISLKQSEITTQINKNYSVQSQAAILPTINLGAQHTYNFGRTIDRYTNTFANSRVLSQNFYASSNVVLWSGLAQYNNIQATKYQYLASTETYLQQRNDLRYQCLTIVLK